MDMIINEVLSALDACVAKHKITQQEAKNLADSCLDYLLDIDEQVEQNDLAHALFPWFNSIEAAKEFKTKRRIKRGKRHE